MRRHLGQLTGSVAWLSFLFSVFPPPAYGYLDPGTGSYILQLALAAVLGLSFAIKLWFKRIKSLLSDLFTKKRGPEQDNA